MSDDVLPQQALAALKRAQPHVQVRWENSAGSFEKELFADLLATTVAIDALQLVLSPEQEALTAYIERKSP